MESTTSSDVIFSTNHWTAHKELDIIDCEGDIYAALKKLTVWRNFSRNDIT